MPLYDETFLFRYGTPRLNVVDYWHLGDSERIRPGEKFLRGGCGVLYEGETMLVRLMQRACNEASEPGAPLHPN